MYLLFLIIPLFLVLFLLNHWRRKKISKKISCMCMRDKCELLNELMEPFGYCYLPSQDLFSTRTDAWQRNMGYCSLYDKGASGFHLIFDCLPVYFDYQGKTWLIETWKGQYGINTGGEVGIYHADRILGKDELEHTLFACVTDAHMLNMSFSLLRENTSIAQLTDVHWWLTAFRPGCFSEPHQLTMQVRLTFPSYDMADAFVTALMQSADAPRDISRRRNTITFCFDGSQEPKRYLQRLQRRWAQRMNRFWCKVYCFLTGTFSLSIDKVLYLYYYLPFAFRKTLRIRKYKTGKR